MRRLEELRAEFDKRNVKLITVSTDLPHEIADERHLHGLQATMLSDRENPIKLVIENFEPGHTETCYVPNHPQHKEFGKRDVTLSKELWIEREDFSEDPPKG